MKENLKKLANYYKPYMRTFWLDMFFAFLASLISLVIPLVVRYITTNVTEMDADKAVRRIAVICGVLVILVLIQFASNYFITNIGHVMGAKIGGQKQRISFARVFLKNPPILIFDEATSALDNESENIVKESLEKLAVNRTTFIDAFILSTRYNEIS